MPLDVERNIRRLRKKLRQIERLERLPTLSDEELLKIDAKVDIRNELCDLLKLVAPASDATNTAVKCHDSGIETELAVANDEESNDENNSSETSQNEIAADVCEEVDFQHEKMEIESTPLECTVENDGDKEYSVDRQSLERDAEQNVAEAGDQQQQHKIPKTPTTVINTKTESGASQVDSKKQTKVRKNVKQEMLKYFSIHHLSDTHNDLICTLSVGDGFMATAGRDTQIHLWQQQQQAEQCGAGGNMWRHMDRTLVGHTNTITASAIFYHQGANTADNPASEDSLDYAASNAHVLITASLDCNIKYWNLNTGALLSSQYTFNPIHCIAYLTQYSMVMIGTGGGKIELWQYNHTSPSHSVTAHDDAVTCIQLCTSDSSSDTRCVTASCDGVVKVWRTQRSGSQRHEEEGCGQKVVLSCLYVSENIRQRTSTDSEFTLSCVRSLTVIAGRFMFIADHGQTVKLVDWKTSTLLQKLPVFSTEQAGSVQCVSSVELQQGGGGGGWRLVVAGYLLDTGRTIINVYKVSLSDAAVSSDAGIRVQYEGSAVDSSDSDATGGVVTSLALLASPHPAAHIDVITAGQHLTVWKLAAKRVSSGDVAWREMRRYLSTTSLPQHHTVSDSDDEDFTDTDIDAPPSSQEQQHLDLEQASWLSRCAIL